MLKFLYRKRYSACNHSVDFLRLSFPFCKILNIFLFLPFVATTCTQSSLHPIVFFFAFRFLCRVARHRHGKQPLFFRLLLWLRARYANKSCRSRRHCRLTADKYFFTYYFCISIFLSLRSLGRHSTNRRKLIKKPVFFSFISVVMARCAKGEKK